MKVPMWCSIVCFKVVGGVTVNRRAAGSRSNGFHTPGASTTVTIDPVVVQPARLKDMELMPEGQRNSAAIVLYTTMPLYTASEPSGIMADLVTYAGETYEVQHLEDWTDTSDYYRAIAVKVPA